LSTNDGLSELDRLDPDAGGGGQRAQPGGCRLGIIGRFGKTMSQARACNLLGKRELRIDKKIEPRPCQLSSGYAASSEAGARIGS